VLFIKSAGAARSCAVLPAPWTEIPGTLPRSHRVFCESD